MSVGLSLPVFGRETATHFHLGFQNEVGRTMQTQCHDQRSWELLKAQK
jgi:hypothetical protein